MKTIHVLTEGHVCHRLEFNPNVFVLLATRDYIAKVVFCRGSQFTLVCFTSLRPDTLRYDLL